jgi:cytochrome c biogenesis protein CcmG, thiol:disulfide interchange protein DsbE
MPERTWKAAFSEVIRIAAEHKLRSGIVAAVVAGSLVLIAVAAGESPASSAAAQAGTGATTLGGGGVDGAGPVRPAGSPAAPAFSLPALGNSATRISLGSYAGKPLIVNFFASWCSPCKQETPLIAKYYRDEHGSVAVVGMDENDVVANAVKFVRADGVSYPVAWDPGIVAASAYGVDGLGLPQTFFLDARHRIVYRVYGPVDEAELRTGTALATGQRTG